MSNSEIGRRELLGATALTALSYSRVLGANDRMNLGVIGCGDRAANDMSQISEKRFRGRHRSLRCVCPSHR